MTALTVVKSQLEPGHVYRRADLERWSNAVDRHVKQLVLEGTLKKLSGGLYLHPKTTSFGDAPAEGTMLVEAFLKDDRFLIASPNLFNGLGLGTTQLYNETVVYNHKRHGRFKLGKRVFRFVMKPHFPSTPTVEFLLVEVVNRLNQLAEDGPRVLAHVVERALLMDSAKLLAAVKAYGGARAKKFFEHSLCEGGKGND
jgi:hypothetical protein